MHTNEGYDEESQDYNIEVSMFTLGIKRETNQNAFKFQDAEESIRLKSFHIKCLTTMWTRKESKASMVTIWNLYKDLEYEKDTQRTKYQAYTREQYV